MIKVEAVIRPQMLDAVKAGLDEIGVHGLTVIEVRGAGRQKGYTQHYRGTEYTVNLIGKIKLEVVVADSIADEVVSVIVAHAKTGEIGDGKIFLSSIIDVVRIRTEEHGEIAL